MELLKKESVQKMWHYIISGCYWSNRIFCGICWGGIEKVTMEGRMTVCNIVLKWEQEVV